MDPGAAHWAATVVTEAQGGPPGAPAPPVHITQLPGLLTPMVLYYTNDKTTWDS